MTGLNLCAKSNDLNRYRCIREPGHEGPHTHGGCSWYDKHVPRDDLGGLSLDQYARGGE